MPSDRKPPKPVRAWAIACRDGSALHIGTVSVTSTVAVPRRGTVTDRELNFTVAGLDCAVAWLDTL